MPMNLCILTVFVVACTFICVLAWTDGKEVTGMHLIQIGKMEMHIFRSQGGQTNAE